MTSFLSDSMDPSVFGRWPRFWMGWGLAFLVGSVLVVLASLPPFLDAGPRVLLHHGFAWACHQIPERSFFVDGVQLAVCHRCYGVYLGIPLAVVAFLGVSRWDALLNWHAKYILLGSLLVPAIDWVGGLLGIWVNTPASRVVTGAVFGLAAGYFLARAFVVAIAGPPSDRQEGKDSERDVSKAKRAIPPSPEP